MALADDIELDPIRASPEPIAEPGISRAPVEHPTALPQQHSSVHFAGESRPGAIEHVENGAQQRPSPAGRPPSSRRSGRGSAYGHAGSVDAASATIAEEGYMHSKTIFSEYGTDRDDRPAGHQRDSEGSGQPRYTTNDTDYEQKYPPDAYGAELCANARFWKVYNEEAQLADGEMVKGLNGTLDVLLVFAGLFSAVVTTFVAQSSQALNPDYAQITASLVHEMTLMQRAMAAGVPISDVPVSRLTLESITRTNTDLWVNGLWLTSLTLSLLTALISVLAKQWIQHFNTVCGGSPLDRAHRRQYRLLSFQRWKISLIVGMLPVLLSCALLLFFAGLAVYVAPMHSRLSTVTIVFACSITAAYVLAILLPMFVTGCAYQTPISNYVVFLVKGLGQLIRLPFRIGADLRQYGMVYWDLLDMPWSKDGPSIESRETAEMHRRCDDLTLEALHWLCHSSLNTSAVSISLEAASAFPMDFKPISGQTLNGSWRRNVDSLERECTSPSLLIGRADAIERLMRTYLHFSTEEENIYFVRSECWTLSFWGDLFAFRAHLTEPQKVILCIFHLLRFYERDLSRTTLQRALDMLGIPDFYSENLKLHVVVWRELDRTVRLGLSMFEGHGPHWDHTRVWEAYDDISRKQPPINFRMPMLWYLIPYEDVTFSLEECTVGWSSGLCALLDGIDNLKILLSERLEQLTADGTEQPDDQGSTLPNDRQAPACRGRSGDAEVDDPEVPSVSGGGAVAHVASEGEQRALQGEGAGHACKIAIDTHKEENGGDEVRRNSTFTQGVRRDTESQRDPRRKDVADTGNAASISEVPVTTQSAGYEEDVEDRQSVVERLDITEGTPDRAHGPAEPKGAAITESELDGQSDQVPMKELDEASVAGSVGQGIGFAISDGDHGEGDDGDNLEAQQRATKRAEKDVAVSVPPL